MFRVTGLILAFACGLTFSKGHAQAMTELNIHYGQHEKQRLDIYPAKGGSIQESTPVVIWVHGGGWRNGDKDNRSGQGLCIKWSESGITMVNLNYRLTPEVQHPAHIEDVAAGVAWVINNIAQRGGDPKRVFLLGHSAGAHLVALLGTAPEYLGKHQLHPSQLAGVLAIDTASYDLRSTQSPAVRKMIKDAFGEDRQVLAGASPLLHAQKDPGASPPMIIATVQQRPDALEESTALHKLLPGSKLIVMDYPRMTQLKAHGQIARDLVDLDNSMTVKILDFVRTQRAQK